MNDAGKEAGYQAWSRLEQLLQAGIEPRDYYAVRGDAEAATPLLVPLIDAFVFAACWTRWCGRFAAIRQSEATPGSFSGRAPTGTIGTMREQVERAKADARARRAELGLPPLPDDELEQPRPRKRR